MSDNARDPNRRGHLFRNWLSLSGLVLASGAVFAFLLLWAIDLLSANANPYVGILTYVVAPGFFLIGLLLIAFGTSIHRRHMRKPGAERRPHVLHIDLSRPRDRRMLAVFGIGTMLFLLITAVGSNRTYHYTESTQFCGQACHMPMKPEYTAYLDSAHARVACVDCHVGSGASAYLASKINGVHQLYCTITGNIERPIKTPVKNLRPAQQPCEQ
jgi:hypothetical protein